MYECNKMQCGDQRENIEVYPTLGREYNIEPKMELDKTQGQLEFWAENSTGLLTMSVE